MEIVNDFFFFVSDVVGKVWFCDFVYEDNMFFIMILVFDILMLFMVVCWSILVCYWYFGMKSESDCYMECMIIFLGLEWKRLIEIFFVF